MPIHTTTHFAPTRSFPFRAAVCFAFRRTLAYHVARRSGQAIANKSHSPLASLTVIAPSAGKPLLTQRSFNLSRNKNAIIY